MARALVSFLALVVAVASASGRGQGTHMQVSLKGTPVLDTVVPTAGFETQHIPVTAHLYAEGSAGMGEEVRPAAHVDVQLASASAAASGLPAAGTLRFAMAKEAMAAGAADSSSAAASAALAANMAALAKDAPATTTPVPMSAQAIQIAGARAAVYEAQQMIATHMEQTASMSASAAVATAAHTTTQWSTAKDTPDSAGKVVSATTQHGGNAGLVNLYNVRLKRLQDLMATQAPPVVRGPDGQPVAGGAGGANGANGAGGAGGAAPGTPGTAGAAALGAASAPPGGRGSATQTGADGLDAATAARAGDSEFLKKIDTLGGKQKEKRVSPEEAIKNAALKYHVRQSLLTAEPLKPNLIVRPIKPYITRQTVYVYGNRTDDPNLRRMADIMAKESHWSELARNASLAMQAKHFGPSEIQAYKFWLATMKAAKDKATGSGSESENGLLGFDKRAANLGPGTDGKCIVGEALRACAATNCMGCMLHRRANSIGYYRAWFRQNAFAWLNSQGAPHTSSVKEPSHTSCCSRAWSENRRLNSTWSHPPRTPGPICAATCAWFPTTCSLTHFAPHRSSPHHLPSPSSPVPIAPLAHLTHRLLPSFRRAAPFFPLQAT